MSLFLFAMNTPILTQSKVHNYGIETMILVPFATVVLTILYSYINVILEFDLIVIGFLGVVFLGVFLPARFITKQKKIKKYSRVIMIGLVAVLLAWTVRQAALGYLVYEKLITVGIETLKADGKSFSRTEVEPLINEFIKEETGYEGILGAYVGELKNTAISNRGRGELEVGMTGGIIIILLELAGGLLVVAFGLSSDLKKIAVFCEQCSEPKAKTSYLFGSFRNFGEIKKGIINKDFVTLRSFFKPAEAAKSDFTSILVFQCTKCTPSPSGSQIEIDVIGHKNQKRSETGKRIVYNTDEFKQLLNIIETKTS